LDASSAAREGKGRSRRPGLGRTILGERLVPEPAVNQSALSSLLWSVADLLRGDYKQADYGKVILLTAR
jgi:hypothetical protein